MREDGFLSLRVKAPLTMGTVAGFYALYFAGVGVILPFLPAYFHALGLTGSQRGVLLALTPAVELLAPPRFGAWADSLGRLDGPLRTVALGMAVCFLPLLWVRTFFPLALVMLVFSVFSTSVTPLLDSLALEEIGRRGKSFASVRVFGSVGFVLASAGFGVFAPRSERAVVWTVLALLILLAAFAGTVLKGSPREREARREGVPLAGTLGWFLGCTTLHWIASAPYNGSFAIHVGTLGLPRWVTGAAVAAGVLAEVGVMVLYQRLFARWSAQRILALSCVGSCVRWVGLAWVHAPLAIIGLSLLHGLTFGAFYVAAVGFVAARVPGSLRASGQSVFTSVTFGLGGLVGYLTAGVGYELLGGHGLFAAAAAVELLAAACLFGIR